MDWMGWIVTLFMVAVAAWTLFEVACAIGHRLHAIGEHHGAWQSDLEYDGHGLPPWAHPGAVRDGTLGGNSGAAQSMRPVRYYDPKSVDERLPALPSQTEFDLAQLETAPTDPEEFDAWLANMVLRWQRQQDTTARNYSAGLEPRNDRRMNP